MSDDDDVRQDDFEEGEEDIRTMSEVIEDLFSDEANAARAAAWAAYYEGLAEDAREKWRQRREEEDGWKDKPEEEHEPVVEGGTTLPYCPYHGLPIDLCPVHDEEELEAIRKHDEDENHDDCDPDGCDVMLAILEAEIAEMEDEG